MPYCFILTRRALLLDRRSRAGSLLLPLEAWRWRRLAHIRRGEDGTANDVPELAHVARPVIPQQDLSRRFRDFAAGAAELHAGFGEKLVRQVEDVISRPERRQGDGEFVQTVVDVLTEPAGPHLPAEPDIGRRQ